MSQELVDIIRCRSDALVMGLAEWLKGPEMELLEELMGLGKGLQCGVGICLLDGGQLFAGQSVAGQQLDVLGTVV